MAYYHNFKTILSMGDDDPLTIEFWPTTVREQCTSSIDRLWTLTQHSHTSLRATFTRVTLY